MKLHKKVNVVGNKVTRNEFGYLYTLQSILVSFFSNGSMATIFFFFLQTNNTV